MRKHRVEKFLKSVFGSHIGPEHSEVIEGKEGIESKIDKILKLLKSGEKNDDDLEIGSELVSLVEEFYDQYKTLYGKYDNLVEKLKKHSHKKEMNGDVANGATSSDSDSSSSDSKGAFKLGRKHGKDNGVEIAGEHISMQDFCDMKMRVDILEKRNGDLESESTSMLSRIEGYEDVVCESARKEAAIAELEEELRRIKESTRALEVVHKGLKEELEYVKMQHSDESRRLASTHEEKEALLLEKLHVQNVVKELKSEKDSLEDATFKLQNENQILKHELESSNKEVDNLKSQFMLLSEESSGHARESMRKEDVIIELEGELGRTKENMSTLEALHESLRQELEALQVQHSDVSLRLVSSLEEKEALLSEKSCVENAFEELKSEKGLLEETHVKLHNDHQILKQELKNSANQVVDLNERLVILNEEKDKLSSEHAHESARRELAILELEEELGRTKATVMNLEEVHENMRRELEALNSQHSDVSLRLATIQEENEALLLVKLHAENAIYELKSDKSLLEDMASKLHDESQILKQDLECSSKQVANLNSQLLILNGEKDNLSSEHARELARREAYLLQLEEELGRIKESHESARQELEAVMLQHSNVSLSLQSTHDEKEVILSEKLRAEIAIEELKSKKCALEEEVVKLQSDVQVLKQDLESSSAQVADLNNRLVIMNEEKDNLISEHARGLVHKEVDIVKLEEERGRLMRELEDVKLQHSDISLSLQNAHEEKVSLLSEKSCAENTIEELKSEKNSSESAVLELRNEIKTLKEDLEISSRQIAELNSQIVILNEEGDRLSSEHATALSKLVVAEKAISDLQNESGKNLMLLDEKSEENVQLLAENDTLNARFAEVDQQRNDLEKEVSVLNDENKMLTVEIAEVEQRRTDLEKDLSVLKDENSALESEIVRFRAQLEELVTVSEKLRSDCEMLKDSEEKLLRVNADLNEDLRSKDGELNCTSLGYAEAVEKLCIAEERIEMLNVDLKSLFEIKSQLSDDHEALKRESEAVVLEARGSADRKARENTDLVMQNEQLKLELEDNRRKIIQLNEDVTVLTDKCSKVESESEEAKETIDRLTTDFQLLREAESKLLAAVAYLERRIEQRDEDNDALSWKYAESVDQYRYAEECVRMLSEELEKQRIVISQLSDDYEGMKEDFIAADGRASELELLLAAVSEEKLEFEKLADDLKHEVEHLNKDNSKLGLGIDELSKKLEDEITNREMDLNEHNRKLEELMVRSHSSTHHMQCAFQQVKEALEKQLERVDVVRTLYLESCGRLHSRISLCSEEIHAVKKRAKEMISKKEESATKLKEELEQKAGEADRLAKLVDNYEKTVPELRTKISELEEEAAFKDEEKREVIRQLCKVIDYQRENCEHLYQLLPTRSKGKTA